MEYQVEYMSRPDETDHVEEYGSNLTAAKTFAKRMSDKHDGSAYVVALRFNPTKHGTEAVGHIVYCFGIQSESEGVLK